MMSTPVESESVPFHRFTTLCQRFPSEMPYMQYKLRATIGANQRKWRLANCLRAIWSIFRSLQNGHYGTVARFVMGAEMAVFGLAGTIGRLAGTRCRSGGISGSPAQYLAGFGC